MRYLLSGTFNTRDLGGYPISLNEHTLYGRLLRSDVPLSHTPNDLQFLWSINVTTVIDLRSSLETDRSPCSLKDVNGFDYYHCQLHGFEQLPQSEDEVGTLYCKHLEHSKPVHDIMKIIAYSEAGVLFHCTAGKDRTGIIAALLLSLVGVPKSDIVADYQVSYTYLYEKIKQLHTEYPDMPAFIGQSKAEYMERFLELFSEKYGSAEKYLLSAGLNTGDIQAIRAKLKK